MMNGKINPYDPYTLLKKDDDEKKKAKKASMKTIFVIPDSHKYKKQITKREKETKQILKERMESKANQPNQTKPSFPLKGQ